MSDSLKDQLIALGIANRKAKGKSRARPKKNEPKGEMSLDQAYRLRSREEKDSARKQKEEKRALDLERKRINRQVQEIVNLHKLNAPSAEIKRNFMYKGRIRSVLCTEEQLRALNQGELGVVFLRGSYYLVRPEHVDAVRKISADHVPELTGPESDEEEDERFKVPDDLVW